MVRYDEQEHQIRISKIKIPNLLDRKMIKLMMTKEISSGNSEEHTD